MPAVTPIYQLPYPLDTDAIASAPAQIQALAEEFERQLQGANFPPPDPAANPPDTVRMVRTSAQSIANASDVFVAWQAADFDSRPGGQAQWASSGFTCHRDGIYSLTAVWPWAANGTGRRNMKILLNGSSTGTNTIAGDAIPASAWENITSVADTIALHTGDTLRMVVAQDCGGALNGGKGASSANNIVGSMALTWLRGLV